MRRHQSVGGWLASWLVQILFLGALVVLLVSCQSTRNIPSHSNASDDTAQTRHPQVTVSGDGVRSIELSVLTYNVAGLPWPMAPGRATAMPEIARQITALSEAGPPIDIVLIQEGFVDAASEIALQLGFRYSVSGPGPDLKSGDRRNRAMAGVKPRKWWKGEGLGAWIGSGLYIFSPYPITRVQRMVFGNHVCAGYDCLANKGAVAVRVIVPGLPAPLDVLTTHLNSTRAAGVPAYQTHRAHRHQVEQLADFWASATDDRHPVILAGDLNIRNSHARFIPLAKLFNKAEFVKSNCQTAHGPLLCDIEVRTDAPWLSSQDVHLYRNGQAVLVQPVEARTVFRDTVDGKLLSDHFGYLVRYRLSWQPSENARAV